MFYRYPLSHIARLATKAGGSRASRARDMALEIRVSAPIHGLLRSGILLQTILIRLGR